MDCERFDLGIRRDAGEMLLRKGQGAIEIEGAIKWLRHFIRLMTASVNSASPESDVAPLSSIETLPAAIAAAGAHTSERRTAILESEGGRESSYAVCYSLFSSAFGPLLLWRDFMSTKLQCRGRLFIAVHVLVL
jgi:hypothetical protein